MRTRVMPSGDQAEDFRFCLVFPRESLSVPVMRRVLGDTLGRLGVDEECIADLLLAVTEACTNVLRHAGPGRRYEVVASIGRHRCLLEVLDSGRGFDPASAPGSRHPARAPARAASRLRRRHLSPAPVPGQLLGRMSRARRAGTETAAIAEAGIAQLPESGRGMAIMRACVDDVKLRSGPGRGTVVSLRKRIEWRNDAPLTHLMAAQLRDAG
jgi:serine/threonine-protein kinase RsbW